MRILVADDFVLVKLALAQIIHDTPHTLTGVRDPWSLPEALAEGPRFDLALVDINVGPDVPWPWRRGCPSPACTPPSAAAPTTTWWRPGPGWRRC